MLKIVWNEQLKSKNLGIWAIIFFFVFFLYSFFDVLMFGSYQAMVNELGINIVGIHFIINGLLAFLTSMILSMSQLKLRLTKSEPVGSTGIPFFSFIFGLFTFGCAPCVVSFLAALGIAFTPIVFPNGNLLWKIILLALIIIGTLYILWRIEKSTCKVSTKNQA